MLLQSQFLLSQLFLFLSLVSTHLGVKFGVSSFVIEKKSKLNSFLSEIFSKYFEGSLFSKFSSALKCKNSEVSWQNQIISHFADNLLLFLTGALPKKQIFFSEKKFLLQKKGDKHLQNNISEFNTYKGLCKGLLPPLTLP